jgi:hypothetical protein
MIDKFVSNEYAKLRGKNRPSYGDVPLSKRVGQFWTNIVSFLLVRVG